MYSQARMLVRVVILTWLTRKLVVVGEDTEKTAPHAVPSTSLAAAFSSQ